MSSRFKLKYIIYICMGLYVIYLAVSMSQINSMLDFSWKYISRTQEASRDLRSRLNELANIIPGLFSSPDLDFQSKERELQRLESDREKSIIELKTCFQGDADTIVCLENAFRELCMQLRKVAANLEDNSSYEKAAESFNLEIMPYIRQVIGNLNEIDVATVGMSEEIQKKIQHRLNLALFISVVFGFIIIFFIILADKREQTKTLELMAREKLFDQLSRNVEEVFIVAENADKFVYVSPNSKRLLHLSSKDLGKDAHGLYEFLGSEKIVAWLKGILNHPDKDNEFFEENIEIEGLNKSFKIRVYSLGEQAGSDARYIISLNDQTQSIRHQEALSVALENAHAASAAKSSFLSHMSHEIRTPMNAIIGMTTIALARLNDQARVQDCLTKISESSRHLLGLINDVLDMSKIESGKLSITHENFNLHQSIANINNIVQPQANSRDLKFDIYLDGVDEEELIGDALRLNQILLNLLSNAYKFTPPGGSISLRIQQIQTNINSVRFRFIVEDTGIGMSEEFLKRIYDPFEQASANTAARYGGTGLGMPITANLITMMGGAIHVESKEGVGTKFIVELPFGLSQSAANKSYHLPHLKILIVDDDAGTCEHAALLLNKMGLQTRWTTSGAEAVKLVQEAQAAGHGFDVCLIDWKMPELDGAETARQIRKFVGDDMLIIIISAYDWTPIEEEARNSGVNDFIAKPFFSSSLYNALLSATRHLESAEEKPENLPHAQYDFSGKRILLVEDNEFNREIAQEFLQMVHAEVDIAENGQQAVEKVVNSTPGYYDLVLMDVQMPVMNGYDATRAIRSSSHPQAKDLIILAMTANAFSEDVANAVASGMNGHIAKPIDVNELYRLLDRYLNQ